MPDRFPGSLSVGSPAARCGRGRRFQLIALVALLSTPSLALAWGPSGHQVTVRLALRDLPEGPLRALLTRHQPYLEAHSTDPDQWRDVSKEEGVHHFLDFDRYGKEPFLDLPRSFDAAERKYGRETLLKNGVVPWQVGIWYRRCVDDLRSDHGDRLLVDLDALGHYAADTHVPFHAVENYDGQLTDQKGIHARWETMLVDRYIHDADLHPFPVRYLDNPEEAAFGWLEESFQLAAPILEADRQVHARNADYTSKGYEQGLWDAVGSTVRARLEASGGDVASLWYSAWIDAGRPALDHDAAEPVDTATAAGIPHDRMPRPKAP